MKCPKCAYVGFEEADRCRHCGYDFSLIGVIDEAPPERRAAETPRGPAYRAPARVAAADADLSRVDAAPLADLPLAATATPATALAAAATLFVDPQPPPARAPLAVRRTAERPRSRATPHVTRRSRPDLLEASSAETPVNETAPADDAPVVAPAIARVLSVLVDIALLAAIDTAVIYLTTQMAGVPLQDAASLPIVPLAAFVLGLNVAYLAVFTANGGQTLGKMALGLRVEGTDGALTFGGAVVRVAAAIAGGLVMGAGFVPALWRDDRRAVHDHIAHTRVVKVSA